MTLRHLSTTALALALSCASAFAADLPSRKEALVPLPPPPIWTGFYVGVNAGGTWWDQSGLTITAAPGTCTTSGPTANLCAGTATIFPNNLSLTQAQAANISGSSIGAGGFLGGGQLGYNYQFAGRFVAGFETDIQGVAGAHGGSNISGPSAIDPAIPTVSVAQSATGSKSLNYLGTVRGRIGFLTTPDLLLYATGGLAYGGANSSASIFQAVVGAKDPQVPAASAGSASGSRVGWTVGGGVEWLFWPQWSAKVEYLYYDLGSATYQLGPLLVLSQTSGKISGSTFPTATTRFAGNVVRAGVNYHFNWAAPAPVLAKY
jgi:outer membrane immunogenic protein